MNQPAQLQTGPASSTLIRSFGAARMAIGAATWLAPSLATRAFGLGASAEQPIVGQLFGAREFVLGALTASGSGAALRAGIAIDGADTVASLRNMRAGAFSTQAKLLVAAGAATFTGIGLAALAMEDSGAA